jgi:sulfite exporter TauE/SafE
MKANVGKIDKTLRIIAGIVMIGLGIYYQSWWGAVGLLPLITGLLRWCPAYLPFGISSCPKE